MPTVSTSGGYEVFSSPFSTSFNTSAKGWVFAATLTGRSGTAGRPTVRSNSSARSFGSNHYDDDARQVELEVQTAYSNLLQNKELIQSQLKNVEEAEEAVAFGESPARRRRWGPA